MMTKDDKVKVSASKPKASGPTLTPDQYIAVLNKAIEMQAKSTCQFYIEALPLKKAEKAKLYENTLKIARNGETPKNNPFI